MPIYNAKIIGRTLPIMVRADTAAKARDMLVDVAMLTAEEMADAMASGAVLWKPGNDVPADAKPENILISHVSGDLEVGQTVHGVHPLDGATITAIHPATETDSASIDVAKGKEVKPKA